MSLRQDQAGGRASPDLGDPDERLAPLHPLRDIAVARAAVPSRIVRAKVFMHLLLTSPCRFPHPPMPALRPRAGCRQDLFHIRAAIASEQCWPILQTSYG
jgi:hypothetical protein